MSQSEQPTQYTPREEPNSLISRSKLRVLDLLCEGPISGFAMQSGVYGSDPLCSIYFDDVQVRNIDGSFNFNASGDGLSLDYKFGGTGQFPISGFEKVENAIPLSSNTKISNPPTGAGPVKNVVASINTETYPDADSVKITIRIPSLYMVSSRGDIWADRFRWAVDISLNNGPFVEQEDIITWGKCTGPYLKDRTYPLPKTTPPQDYYEWKVRVRKVTTDVMSASVNNDLYVDSICVISNTSFSYPSSAIASLKLGAEQFATPPVRAYELMGMMISVPHGYSPTVLHPDGTVTQAIYPEIWNGVFSSEKKWSNNPAWVFYDLLTNKRYGLGKYLKSDWVDKWTLYEIAQYCDELVDDGEGGLEPRFTCNIVLQKRTDAYSLLMNLSSIFRGMLYWSNGRLFSTFTGDKSPIYNFTNSNVVDGVFNYSDTAKNTRSTVIKVRWTNPKNLYRESIDYVEDTDGILKYGYIEKDITAFGCTSKGQAIRIGNWALQTEKLLTETVTFQTGPEGNYIRPGDIFNVYDNFRNNRQQGGRIKSFDSTLIELDRPVILNSGYSYALSVISPTYNLESFSDITGSDQISQIRNSQIQNREVIVSSGGTISSLNVNSPYSGIEKNSIWLLYSSGTSPSVFSEKTAYRCLALSETQDKNIEILGLIYRTGLNYSIETGYSVRTVPVNPVNNEPISAPTNLGIDLITGLRSNNQYYSYYKVEWTGTQSTNLAYYRVSGQSPGNSWEKLNSSQATRISYNTTIPGRYNFKINAISNGGMASSYISGGIDLSNSNPLGGPPILSGVYISKNLDQNFSQNTGYFSAEPEFSWTLLSDLNGNPEPRNQYISGYKFHILNPANDADLISPVTLDYSTRKYQLSRSIYQNFSIPEKRDIKISIEVIDNWGSSIIGDEIIVNNQSPLTGFTGNHFFSDQDNLIYDIPIHENDKNDISGVYLWYNQNLISPFFGNQNYITKNLAGTINTNITGEYYTWYSPIDTFGASGCKIAGPFIVQHTNTSIPTGTSYLVNGVSGLLNSAISSLTTGLLSVNTDISGLSNTISNIISETTDYAAAIQTEIIERVSGYTGTLAIINTEQILRISGDSAEATQRTLAIAQVYSQLSGITGATGSYATLAALMDEISSRTSGDNAEASYRTAALANTTGYINSISGIINTNTNALVSSESTARSNADSAEANQRNLAIASASGYALTISGVNYNQTVSLVGSEATARSNADSAEATQRNIIAASLTGYITGISGANFSYTTSLVGSETTARANADSAEANQRNLVAASLTGYIQGVSGVTNAAINTTNSTLVTTGSALAAQINNVTTTANGMTGNISILSAAFITGNQAVASWGLTVGADGSIAGIQATAANGMSPISTVKILSNVFQIQSSVNGSVTYPFTVNATGSIVVGVDVESNNYIPYVSGYKLARESGTAQFAGGLYIGTVKNHLIVNNNGYVNIDMSDTHRNKTSSFYNDGYSVSTTQGGRKAGFSLQSETAYTDEGSYYSDMNPLISVYNQLENGLDRKSVEISYDAVSISGQKIIGPRLPGIEFYAIQDPINVDAAIVEIINRLVAHGLIEEL